MRILQDYADMLLNGEIKYKRSTVTVHVNDCSLRGFSLELAVKDFLGLPLEISRSYAIDIPFMFNGKKVFAECKSNSSPFITDYKRCSIMMYAFCVQLDKPLNQQWGYIMPMKLFLAIGHEYNHIKQGTHTNGKYSCVKTQTVWNNKKQQPHGTKAYKLEDAYLASGEAISFNDFFKETV